MKEFFYRLLRPRHWLRNYPTSAAWDSYVLRCIADGKIKRLDRYTADLDGKVVWVENYPSAYGQRYPGEVMPRASTVDLLAEALAVSK